MILLFLIAYTLVGIGCAYLYLERQRHVIASDLIAAVIVIPFWPIYLVSIGVMSHFNGD